MIYYSEQLFSQKHRAAGEAVCTVESVDGAPTFAEECRRGASVVVGKGRCEVLAAAKNSEMSG